MRFPALLFAASFALGAAFEPLPASAQQRDFVFTDFEGHMVLRFVGVQRGALEEDYLNEMVNVSLSTMVHDRLQADSIFDAEPVDSEWADATAPKIRSHLGDIGAAFSGIEIECRSSTCRVLLHEAERTRLPEHQALMGVVQREIQAFIDANPASFDPAFLMAAYDQDAETPHIKVFLRRATPRS